MKKLRILIFILVGFSACKAYQPPTIQHQVDETEQKNQPDWVSQKPISDSYYIGIGNASLADADHQANAKLEALDDLASEISVTVASSSLLHQIENSSGYNEQFQFAIKSTTKESLELHEQTANWRGDTYYWVQYRLSKQEFEKLRADKKAKVTSIAKTHFIKGKTAEDNGEVIQSLNFYAQSIEALSGYLNEPNTVQIENRFADIPIEAYARIASILSSIILKSDSLSYELGPTERNKGIIVNAGSKTGQPINGLRIKTSETEYKVTNENGEIYLDINARDVSQTLTLTADFDFLEKYPITHSLVRNIEAPRTEIRFHVPVIKMSITASEQNLGEQMRDKVLTPLVRKILTEKGYSLVDDEGDYEVKIQSNTRKGGEISGLYTSYLDFTLDIKNGSGSSVFSDSFSNVKGIHSSYQQAGIRAYQNAEKQVKDQLVESLQKNFFNKD